MAIQIGAKPDSGFDDPLGMLKDCHRRIEGFLGILCRIAERAQSRELNEEEAAAVEAALRYFRSGGQRHTADEEESLFPRLRASPVTTPEALGRLEADHRDAEHLHESVERLYSRWIAANILKAVDERQLLSDTKRLEQLYFNHIRVEETVVFPHAAKVLDGPTIAVIGAEFEARRKQS